MAGIQPHRSLMADRLAYPFGLEPIAQGPKGWPARRAINAKRSKTCRLGPLLWARLGLNQRPLACEASALPLSYEPVSGEAISYHQIRMATALHAKL